MRLCPAFDAASLSCDACDGGGRGRCEKSLVAGGRDHQGRYFVESAALSPAKRLDHCCCHMLASGGKALLLFFLLLRVWGLCLCVHACAHSCISEEGEGAGLGQNYEERRQTCTRKPARPPARTHARMHACMHARTHARTHTHTHTHSHTHTAGGLPRRIATDAPSASCAVLGAGLVQHKQPRFIAHARSRSQRLRWCPSLAPRTRE